MLKMYLNKKQKKSKKNLLGTFEGLVRIKQQELMRDYLIKYINNFSIILMQNIKESKTIILSKNKEDLKSHYRKLNRLIRNF